MPLTARELWRSLAIDTAGTVILNVATMVGNFAIAVVVSRLLGAEGYGAYAFAIAWVAVLAVPASLGLSPLVIREIAASLASGDFPILRGLLRWSNASVALASSAVVGLAAFAGWALAPSKSDLLDAYLVGLLLVPLFAFTSLRQSAMQGLGRVVLGRTPETFITPFLFLALIGVAYILSGADDRSAASVVGLNVSAAAVAFAFGVFLVRRSLPNQVSTVTPAYRAREWLRATLPLVVLSALFAVQPQIGTIVVAAMEEADEAGIYNVAQRVALLVGFLHLAVMYPLMPTVSRLHATREASRIEALLRTSALTVIGLSAPVALGLFVFSEQVLRIFGDEFAGGATTLRVLVAGTALHLISGFAGLALMMTGNERSVTKAFASGTAVTVTLTLVLVPVWGAEGAAVGFVSGLLIGDIVVALAAWRQLGMFLPALPRPRHRS